MAAKVYVGERLNSGLSVHVKETGQPIRPLEHHVRHSPTGFECGYAGSGPADLARCILIDHFDCADTRHQTGIGHEDSDGPAQQVERLYQPFKFAVIALLPSDSDWQLTTAQIETAIT